MKYNIAIIPPKNISSKSIELSEELYKSGGKFKLGNQTNFPHITIAHFDCFEERKRRIVIDQFIDKISAMKSFFIKQDKYRDNDGWIDISFKLKNDILLVYNDVCHILQKNNCVKTSDNWIDNSPHITLSRLNKDKNFNIKTLPKYDFSFIVNEIGFFELGEHGTNKRLLKKFELKTV